MQVEGSIRRRLALQGWKRRRWGRSLFKASRGYVLQRTTSVTAAKSFSIYEIIWDYLLVHCAIRTPASVTLCTFTVCIH